MNRRKALWATLGIILLPYLGYIIYMWHHLPVYDGVATGPSDPDIWLRLTMVREWITSGDWYNHVIPNYNLPQGSMNHWTRPVDLVVRGLAWCMPDAALNDRLIHAAMLMPLIWLTLLLLGVFRIVRHYSAIPDSILMSGVMLSAMPITRNYFGLGNADHHAPLAVLFIWILGTIMQPRISRVGAVAVGLMLALMLWISVEGIAMIMLVYGWFGLLWLLREKTRVAALPPLAIACFLGSLLALGIEHPPTQWLEPIYDAHSIVYVAALGGMALLAMALPLTLHLANSKRLPILGVSSALVGAILVHYFPDIVHGALAKATPYIRDVFMKSISEAKPLFTQPILMQLALIIYPLMAIWTGITPFERSGLNYYRRNEALPILYFCTLLLLMVCAQIRWNYYLYPLVIAILSPLYGALFSAEDASLDGRWPATLFRRFPESKRALMRLPLIIATMGLPIVLALLNPDDSTPSKNASADEAFAKKIRSNCEANTALLIRSGELERRLGKTPKTILLSTNAATEIIFFTPYRVIASNYHRDGDAVQYVWEAFELKDTQKLKERLMTRQVDAIINCPDSFSKLGVLYEYLVGKTPLPDWLQLVPYSLPQPKEPDPEEMPPKKIIFPPQLLLVQPVANK